MNGKNNAAMVLSRKVFLNYQGGSGEWLYNVVKEEMEGTRGC